MAGFRHERLAKRKVDVDGTACSGLCIRPGGEPSPQAAGIRHLDGSPGVDEPAHRGTEDALLVDRLVGPDSLQLGRAVGGQNDQGSARVGRFDHSRVKLRGRGAGRAQEDDRLPCRLRQADPEERAAPLVDVHDHLDPWVVLERHRDGRGAGPRRDARELDALRRQLVDEGCGERLRYIHTISL